MLLYLPSLKCDEPSVAGEEVARGELLTPSSSKGTSLGLLRATSCTRLGSNPDRQSKSLQKVQVGAGNLLLSQLGAARPWEQGMIPAC